MIEINLSLLHINTGCLKGDTRSEEQLVQDGITTESPEGSPTYFHFKWTFLDSYRLFNVSLDTLCKMFKVPGKLSKYDTSWNNISLFDDHVKLELFKQYSLQDSISLLNALSCARNIYCLKAWF